MPSQELLEEIREDREKALGQVENHCPFGCKREDLTPEGYCHHLMGFTNDGVNYEPVTPILRKMQDGKTLYDTDYKRVGGSKLVRYEGGLTKRRPILEAIKPSDKLVNPEFIQTVQGISYQVKKWVSARVYRNVPRPQELAETDQGPEDGLGLPQSDDVIVESLRSRIRELEAANKPKRKGGPRKKQTRAKPTEPAPEPASV